jgi:succinate-acetate transporter protein
MSTIDERRERAFTGVALAADRDGGCGDFARPRVVLSPIAAPSVLGLFGFAGATFIVAANLGGWYGTKASPGYLFPFAMFFGGLAQFSAGMWAYKSRDAVATAMHGIWGSFWLGYGVLNLLVATRRLRPGQRWSTRSASGFIALCGITASGTLGALAEANFGVTAVLTTFAAGSGLAATGFLQGDASIQLGPGISSSPPVSPGMSRQR